MAAAPAGGAAGGTTTLTGTSNALTSSDMLYNGLTYVVQHPFVNDPLRPGKVDRVIAASFAFGSTQTFQTEVDAYKNYPQVVIALKNQYHKFLKEGIAPIAAAGQFGAPLGAGAPSSTTGGTTGGASSGSTTVVAGDNNADNSSLGDVNGMSLPAVLNEVISVTGVFSFPYDQTAASPPTDAVDGVIPSKLGPLLLFGDALTIGGTATAGSSNGGGGAGGGGAGGGGNGGGGAGGGGAGGGAAGGGGGAAPKEVLALPAAQQQAINDAQASLANGAGGATPAAVTGAGTFNANANLLAAGDFTIYANRISAGVNRSNTTDFAAPAYNVPTFRRTFSSATGTTSTSAGSPTDHLTFGQVGTSVSAAIVTGSYALVSSALNYWTNLALSNGYSADAYLNTPVGTNSLNFGKHAFKNLSAWNNPSGINGILAWTAVPAVDANDGGSLSTPPTLPGGVTNRSFATVNVANAIAAVEGYVAINYLLAHHDFTYIDTNHDGLITAQEVTTFVDNSAAMGLPEAGAMAALLGGTATYSAVEAGINNTVFNENPDDPAALQRRFNFFDYAADGQLNGSITMNELRMLSRTLLPAPDAYTIVDRQRASANGFLLAPTAQRNIVALQHILPKFEWVPPNAVKRYRNISPAWFGVDKGVTPGTTFPLYTLFDPVTTVSSQSSTQKTVVSASKTANINGVKVTVDWLSAVPTPTASSNTLTTTPSTSSKSASSSLAAATPAPAPAPAATGPTSPTSVSQSVLNSLLKLAKQGVTTSSAPATSTFLPPAVPNPSAASPPSSVTTPVASSPSSLSPAGTVGTQTAPPAAPAPAPATPAAPAPAPATPAAPAPVPATPAPAASAATSLVKTAASKKAKATKAKSTGSTVSRFFTDIGNSIKKAF